ncbi:MAG: X-Pro dipeptidyl-peptidase [Candidatus Rokuibacteriota bacterium]|nr:MAG: X-Pro dipeptidyl-peptidase [Candidatus Rokubacteria bacterium]
MSGERPKALSVTTPRPAPARPRHRVRTRLGLPVPMRDGVKLATDVYLPDAPGPFPVILIRTPYSTNVDYNVQDGVFFAQRGYAVVVQDVRGRFDSEGEWTPFVHEAEDGYDAQEWCGTQPWSTGKVGTSGGSYLALTQWLAAPCRNRHLAAMAPRVGFSNLYQNWVYTGGAFQLGFNLRWGAVQMHTRTNRLQHLWVPPELQYSALFRHLPLITGDESAGRECGFYKDWIRHPDHGPYWERLGNVERSYGEIDVPAYGFGGWYDVFLQGTLNNFVGVRAHGRSERARRGQKVLIGPWIHDLGGRGTQTRTGEVDFGPEALVDLRAEELRWFDQWLLGIDTGVLDEPPVRVFVMGQNRWRTADAWPIPGTAYVEHYFHGEGKANSLFGDGRLDRRPPESEPPDRYVYDPANPVPTLGGSTCCGEDITPIPMGPRDQQPAEWRPDVVVYTGAPLEADLEVTGPIKVVLWAASSAPDTDFTAKLVDVHPSGFAVNVAQGIIRARYRESFERPSLLEPGRVYRYEIDCWSSSNCFGVGHRIRVEISSSNFPQFDRNPNTGHAFGMDADLEPATQTVYHDARHPSHILLPVVA